MANKKKKNVYREEQTTDSGYSVIVWVSFAASDPGHLVYLIKPWVPHPKKILSKLTGHLFVRLNSSAPRLCNTAMIDSTPSSPTVPGLIPSLIGSLLKITKDLRLDGKELTSTKIKTINIHNGQIKVQPMVDLSLVGSTL